MLIVLMLVVRVVVLMYMSLSVVEGQCVVCVPLVCRTILCCGYWW